MSTFARATFFVNAAPRPISIPPEFMGASRYTVNVIKHGAEVRDRNKIVATYYGINGENVAKKAAHRLNRADEQDGERWDSLS